VDPTTRSLSRSSTPVANKLSKSPDKREANFGDVHRADIELVERLAPHNAVTLGSGLGFRPSDRIFVSSNHAIRARHLAHW
jgi:hypothetical protein